MVDHLMGLRMASPKKCVIYFFCDYADTDSIESATIIASLIKQILTVYPMTTAIENILSQNILLGGWKKKQNDLWALLQDALAIPEETYIVIDGLDECARGELPFLASNFEDLASSSKRKVQLLLFSREMLDLPRQFSRLTRLSLDHDLISTDIGKFIDTTVKKKWSTGILNVGDDTIIDEIIMALTRGAQGMYVCISHSMSLYFSFHMFIIECSRFLWVDFQIKAICDEYTDDDIRLALQNLPSDLEQTYVRALRKILKGPKSQKSQAEIARKVFNWVACARRPMLLEELREAISITPGQPSFIEARLINNPIRIVQACANMVTFDEKQQTVRFAHHTVKQFLCSAISEPDCQDFTIDRSKADYEAGKICVTYLNFSDFERQVAKVPQKSFLNSSTPDTILELHQLGRVPKSLLTRAQRLRKRSVAPVDAGNILSQLVQFQSKDSSLYEQFSFLQYACQNWIFHCTGFSDSDEDSWRLFGNLVFGRILPVPYIPWSEDYTQGKPQYWTQFAWAIENGHTPLARLLGSKAAAKEDYANAELQTGVMPLQIACTRGNEAVVLYLLEIGADVNAAAASDGGRTALQAAVGGGHLEIVNRLLTIKADVNAAAAGNGGRTALQAAAGGGHLEIVDRLLAAKADVNAAAAYGGRTVLQAAAGGGHLEIVDRLLAAKADVNAASYDSRTALQAAAEGGHLKIVDRLKKAGAEY
jgi:ankyrin repeat protein